MKSCGEHAGARRSERGRTGDDGGHLSSCIYRKLHQSVSVLVKVMANWSGIKRPNNVGSDRSPTGKWS